MAAVASFTAACTWMILKAVDEMVGFLVSLADEATGLDISQRDGRAYSSMDMTQSTKQ